MVRTNPSVHVVQIFHQACDAATSGEADENLTFRFLAFPIGEKILSSPTTIVSIWRATQAASTFMSVVEGSDSDCKVTTLYCSRVLNGQHYSMGPYYQYLDYAEALYKLGEIDKRTYRFHKDRVLAHYQSEMRNAERGAFFEACTAAGCVLNKKQVAAANAHFDNLQV